MMEEAQEEVINFETDPSSNNNNDSFKVLNVKGKRTKRQRPQSPVPFPISAMVAPSPPPPPDYSDEFSTATDEENDMANCLILLARGHFNRPATPAGDRGFRNFKVSATYECKTCSRTFPSFQALGGHRTSHKKPKATPIAADVIALSDEEGKQPTQFKINSHAPLHLESNNKNSNKVHECSICGAEFMSGQALGGHMRRHRGPVTTNAAAPIANTDLSLGPTARWIHEETKKLGRDGKPRGGGGEGGGLLCLDLNLPAAMPEDRHRNQELEFSLACKQKKEEEEQQQPQQKETCLVFSAPTLVDCHY